MGKVSILLVNNVLYNLFYTLLPEIQGIQVRKEGFEEGIKEEEEGLLVILSGISIHWAFSLIISSLIYLLVSSASMHLFFTPKMPIDALARAKESGAIFIHLSTNYLLLFKINLFISYIFLVICAFA